MRPADDPAPTTTEPPSYPPLVRLAHALTAVLMVVLVGSGLQIFNAHPTLYAADDSNDARIVFSMPAQPDPAPQPDPKAQAQAPTQATPGLEMIVFGHPIPVSANAWQAFPAPLALGGWLEGGRRLHFMAAWLFALVGLVYLARMLFTRRKHFVWPGKADLRALGPALRDHLRIPPRLLEPGGRLNPLQKLAYFAVPVVLAPWVVASGLALSPRWDAIFPFWVDLFGGRQFARTWHFAGMLLFVAFTCMHLLLVALAGPRTWLHMITGRVETIPERTEP